jgi:hypothetical protein
MVSSGMLRRVAVVRTDVSEELSTSFMSVTRNGELVITLKNGVFWDVTPCALVRTDVSEEPSASFIRVSRIGELGTTLAATSNQRTLRAVLCD